MPAVPPTTPIASHVACPGRAESRRRGAFARVVVLIGALAGSATSAGPLQAAPDDHLLKADMICNLAKFVQWPDAVTTLNKGQIVITILGEDELAADMAGVLSSRSVNGKPVFVRFARRPQDVRGSQIVYIAASESLNVESILKSLKGTPTLTLAEAEGFVARGGMVDFAVAGPPLRFEIGLVHAEEAGLRISSRLLALARVVDQSR